MNLIERYGYERAKRELGYMDERSIAMISDSIEYREELRKELLEYRRANNIFEVGDDVCFLDKNSNNDMVYVIDSVHSDGLMVLDDGAYTYAATSSMLRHAAPEEIAAGHRL